MALKRSVSVIDRQILLSVIGNLPQILIGAPLILMHCPASSINKLQVVQHVAARVLTRSRKYHHITQILQSLDWLPIKFRISYKILLLAYKALNDLAPAYLTNLLSRYNPTHS